MKTRNVETIVAPRTAHFVGDGFRVHNFIPSMPGLEMERMSPFVLLDYNSKYYFPPADKPRGVGVHPHKGFETVTIAYKGKVAHHDSAGGGGVIEEGDVQWMTAASGVLHKEYHEEKWSKKGGDFQMVQLWVNLPAKDKKGKPHYQAIQHKNIQAFQLDNMMGEVEVIAGEYKGTKGAASTFTPIQMYNLRLKKGASLDFSLNENDNTVLLVLEGSIKINGIADVSTDHLALMAKVGDTFLVEATTEALVLLLSGEPINEPIATHGPFVMNTKEELVEAFNEYNNGKFGFLED